MPLRIIVQDPDGRSRTLTSKPFSYEEVLQTNIVQLPNLIPLETVTDESVQHITIGVEWPVGTGRADIVLVGSDGILTIVETKLSRNPEARREVVAQVLEYAAYLSEWTIFEIQRQAEEFLRSEKCPDEYKDKRFDEALEVFLQETESVDSFKSKVEQNLRQGRIRLIVAVDEVGEQVQKIITFLNAYSAFDIYLLQISVFEDAPGHHVFVPSLYGYARKVSTTRTGTQWDWEKYRTELGWSDEQIANAQGLVRQLQVIARDWQPETRFHEGWISIHCFGREAFGVQVFKRRGLELWFRLEQPPEGVPSPSRQRKQYAYYAAIPGDLHERQLRTLCEASLRQLGIEPVPRT